MHGNGESIHVIGDWKAKKHQSQSHVCEVRIQPYAQFSHGNLHSFLTKQGVLMAMAAIALFVLPASYIHGPYLIDSSWGGGGCS
jgi:hypothetical protein